MDIEVFSAQLTHSSDGGETVWLQTAICLTNASFYTAGFPAVSRAVSFYVYDGGGYGATQCFLRNSCAYDLTRNLKTDSFFYGPATGNPTAWTSSPRDEQYGYDPNFDYLTSANYNDGLPNQTPTWSYDAAGNRTDSVVDDLNRTEVQVNGQWQTNCDTLGNRLFLGTTTYSWDARNRMTQYANSGIATNYEYRADGIRTHKSSTSDYTEYYHDGQMPVEDANFSGGSFTVNRYGMGPRGLDYMESGTASTRPTSYPNVGFPLYDGHGNMIGTVSRASGGSFTVGNQRSYDAWGAVRQGLNTGDPKNRYCANLGHQQDDESSLVYMRARYYEPGSGRFVNEDAKHDGSNWFVYAGDDPVGKSDMSGEDMIDDFVGGMFIGFVVSLFSDWQKGDVDYWTDFKCAVAGGVGGVAVGWLRDVLIKVAVGAKRLNWAGRVLTWSFGLGAAIATAYGLEQGKILAEMFEDAIDEAGGPEGELLGG